ncbi:sperm microtubule associated protein 2 [Gastrophryne carolinensis]
MGPCAEVHIPVCRIIVRVGSPSVHVSMCEAQDSESVKSRLVSLAQPKPNFLKSQDKPSVYWQDKLSMSSHCDQASSRHVHIMNYQFITDLTHIGAKAILALTARQEELARHKSVSNVYIQDRPSPIWPVKASALLAVASPRVEKLAQAKTVSQYWIEDRSVYSIVTKEAKRASASARIIHLAKPKTHTNNLVPSTPKKHEKEEEEASPRSKLEQKPTTRIEALAAPKTEHPQYQQDLPVQRQVSASAVHAQASDRVCQLAKPKTRKAIFEGYDPYRISPAAKHAEASPRIVELCTPPARRQRHIKV